MAMKWTSKRTPHSIDDLTTSDRAQLLVISRLYFGEERAIETLVPPEGPAGYEEDFLFGLSVSAILEDGVHAYDAWSYAADSGTFFRAGTTEVVGEIIQCGFEPHYETEAGVRFAAAYEDESE